MIDTLLLPPANPTSGDLLAHDPDAAIPAAAYLAELGSPESRRGMASALNTAAHALTGVRDWESINWTLAMNAAVIAALIKKIEGAPATKNKTLSALKGVARSAYRLDLISGDTFTKIKEVKGSRGRRLPKGRHLSEAEIRSLLDVCMEDDSPAGYRDAAMITLAASTGARRAEIAAIGMEDMEETGDGYTISVIGKGDRERFLYVPSVSSEAVSEWIGVRGETDGKLFCPIRKGGVMMPESGMSTTALHKILVKRVEEAGCEPLTWHDFRRTVAGRLMDKGKDISIVAGILGHASVTTTMRYDRRGERAKIRAANLLEVPYTKRIKA